MGDEHDSTQESKSVAMPLFYGKSGDLFNKMTDKGLNLLDGGSAFLYNTPEVGAAYKRVSNIAQGKENQMTNNPFLQALMEATRNSAARTTAQGHANLRSQANQGGYFGGDRMGVMQGEYQAARDTALDEQLNQLWFDQYRTGRNEELAGLDTMLNFPFKTQSALLDLLQVGKGQMQTGTAAQDTGNFTKGIQAASVLASAMGGMMQKKP